MSYKVFKIAKVLQKMLLNMVAAKQSPGFVQLLCFY